MAICLKWSILSRTNPMFTGLQEEGATAIFVPQQMYTPACACSSGRTQYGNSYFLFLYSYGLQWQEQGGRQAWGLQEEDLLKRLLPSEN